MVSEHEQRLERQKQLLTQKLLGNNNKENESEQNSKIKQIFQLLREDTVGLPAEITNEDLKLLLKSVAQSEDKKSDNKPNIYERAKLAKEAQARKKQQKEQEKRLEEEEDPNLGIGKNGKPIWNYKNRQGKKAVPNSMKDPHYKERVKSIEERRRKKMEYFQNQAEKNNEKYREYKQQRNYETYEEQSNVGDYPYNNNNNNNRINNNSSMSQTSSSKQPHQESILNLLTKNLASNPIYEEDEDMYLKNNNNKPSYAGARGSNSSLSELNSGFVPFMRTNEVLDPVHAGSPVPPSRETSAIKRDREKARQVLKD